MASAIENENNFAPCVPWEVSYIPAYQNLETLVSTCDSSHAGSNQECAIATCKVESLFVAKVLELSQSGWFGTTYNQAYLHDSSGFAPTHENCPTIAGGGPRDKSCCGAYPYRRPYHTRGGLQACCSDGEDFMQIYRPLTHTKRFEVDEK